MNQNAIQGTIDPTYPAYPTWDGNIEIVINKIKSHYAQNTLNKPDEQADIFEQQVKRILSGVQQDIIVSIGITKVTFYKD